MKLSQYRKELKSLGFKLQIKSFSFGRIATYIHVESNLKSGDIMPKSTLEKFGYPFTEKLKPFILDNKETLEDIAEKEEVKGLILYK